MKGLFGILALVASLAGCVAASPYESGPQGYYEPGYYAPHISIGVGVGGGF